VVKISDVFVTLKQRWVIAVIVVSIVLVLLSPLFAYAYEPLDVVAEKYGAEESAIFEAPMPDYILPPLGETEISGILAGLIGVFIVLAVSLALGYALVRPRKQ